jgi:hypothetical protein
MGVVVNQLEAQTPSLNPYRGISLGIEVLRPSEHFGGDLIFLQRKSRVRQGVIAEIAKQFAKRLRFAKSLALNNLVDLASKSVFIGELKGCNRHVTIELIMPYLPENKKRGAFL